MSLTVAIVVDEATEEIEGPEGPITVRDNYGYPRLAAELAGRGATVEFADRDDGRLASFDLLVVHGPEVAVDLPTGAARLAVVMRPFREELAGVLGQGERYAGAVEHELLATWIERGDGRRTGCYGLAAVVADDEALEVDDRFPAIGAYVPFGSPGDPSLPGSLAAYGRALARRLT